MLQKGLFGLSETQYVLVAFCNQVPIFPQADGFLRWIRAKLTCSQRQQESLVILAAVPKRGISQKSWLSVGGTCSTEGDWWWLRKIQQQGRRSQCVVTVWGLGGSQPGELGQESWENSSCICTCVKHLCQVRARTLDIILSAVQSCQNFQVGQ